MLAATSRTLSWMSFAHAWSACFLSRLRTWRKLWVPAGSQLVPVTAADSLRQRLLERMQSVSKRLCSALLPRPTGGATHQTTWCEGGGQVFGTWPSCSPCDWLQAADCLVIRPSASLQELQASKDTMQDTAPAATPSIKHVHCTVAVPQILMHQGQFAFVCLWIAQPCWRAYIITE